MDWSDPVSAGISAGGSLLGGLFSSWNNRQLMKKQQQYNTSERIASQDWQNQQREAQNQFSEDMYNKYSSPQALVQQYNDAGLNPRLAAEGGQVGSVQASSGTSGGAPSGAMPSAPFMQSPDFTQGFVNMANVLKSIAEAKQVGVQTDYLEATFNDRVRMEKVTSDAAELKYKLDLKYGDAERLAALLNTKSTIDVNSAQAKKLQKDYDILCEELHIKKFEREHLWDTYFWYEQNQIVSVGQGQANVKHTEADTEFIRLKQETEKEFPNLYRALTRVHSITANLLAYDEDTEKTIHEVDKQTREYSLQMARQTIDKQLDYLEEQIALAEKTNDTFYLNMIKDTVAQIIGTAIAVGLFKQGSRRLQLEQKRFGLSERQFESTLNNRRPMAPIGY